MKTYLKKKLKIIIYQHVTGFIWFTPFEYVISTSIVRSWVYDTNGLTSGLQDYLTTLITQGLLALSTTGW